MIDLPAPPYPADTRAKGWRFELDYERIEQSDTWSLAAEIPMAQHALLMLWLVAWTQVPCGSLPSDEAIVRAKCRIPPSTWAKCRGLLMRGWNEASDGRLYHPVLVQRVMEMTQTRNKDADRKRGFDSKVARIKERDGAACVYCGDTKYLHIDHLIPMAQGGTHGDKNLVCACRRCNTSKGSRNPDQAGLSFVNESARRMWDELKNTQDERGHPAESQHGNALRTRDAHGTNDTGTGTGTIREIHSAPNGAGATAPPASVDVIFALGVPLLTAANVSDRNARSMLGLMRKTHGDHAVVDALQRCATERPIEPVSWLQAALKPGPPQRKTDALMAGNIAAAQRYVQRVESIEK